MNTPIERIKTQIDYAKNFNVNKFDFWWRDYIAKNILTKKYYHDEELEVFNKGGTENEDIAFDMFVNRVASIVPEYDDEVMKFMKNSLYSGDFILAGRSLYGAGAKGKFKSSMSNCYILPKPEDNLDSIFDVSKEMARIFSYGGGCGVDISNLRPKNAKVKNVARTSSGAVSFMNLFSSVGELIAQQNRRGAILIAMDCNHPDIEDFLTIKQNNDKVQGANISIKFTDEFMQAVKGNKDIQLYFKVKATGEEITKTINAGKFFTEFAEAQHGFAEPGALFIDTVRNWNMLSEYKDYKIDVTNPCVTGDTLILTDKGNIPIKELADKDVNVWNGYRWSKVKPKITAVNQKLLKIYFSDGSYIRCTPYHKFVLKGNTRVEAQYLKHGDKLAKWNYPVLHTNNSNLMDVPCYYTAGFYCGDGTKDKREIVLYSKKQELKKYLDMDYYYQYDKENPYTKVTLRDFYDKDFIPKDLDSVTNKLEYLAGLCDSDGTVNSQDGSISISSVNVDFLHGVRLMLSTIGIKSSVSLMREGGEKLLPTHNQDNEYKKYNCKPCYRLLINAYNVLQLLKLGFTPHRLEFNNIANRDAGRYITIIKIEESGIADKVYCMNEPYNHTFVANGILTGNCAEFCGNEYNSCNLSSVNLYNFVKNPFTRNAEFDFERFKQTVTNAVHMANYVLDYGYDTQPLEENRKCIDNWRSIGIGVFGVADMLVALGIPYGSKDSIKVIEDIMKHMQVYTFEASIENARKNGTFDKFDWQKTVKSKYVQALIKNYGEIYNMSEKGAEAELINKLSKYGLANGTILSIAPTGSIAMLFRESGGVEPYYQVCYERTTHQLEKEHKKFTISMLAVEHMLKSSAMCKDMVLGKDITEKEIKEMFPWVVNTYDVSPYHRVSMQSAMQKYVDNAISSTINLKESANPFLIFDLYLYAWQKGCKGITVFRDNCERINILGKNHGKTRDDKQDVSLDENAKPVEDNNNSIEVVSNTPVLDSIMPYKRNPQTSLWGRTFLYHTACVPKFYVTVNIKDGELFEVFVGADKGCQANIATITRLTSLCLRSGIKVDEVIKNLNSALCPACANQKRKGDLTVNKSCASCIASALVEMRKSLDGGKAELDDKQKVEFTEVEKVPAEIKMVKVSTGKPKLANCPECGKNTLIAEGRCYYCSNCGWSKCD